MKGIERAESRAKCLLEGNRIPVLLRPVTKNEWRIYGFSSSEQVTYTIMTTPTGIEVDSDGVLYKHVEAKRTRNSLNWEIIE